MDGWMDGWVDGWMDGWMDGLMDFTWRPNWLNCVRLTNLHITNKLKTTHAQLHITECNSITYYMISAQIQICPQPPQR
jgi:hypothetical protein